MKEAVPALSIGGLSYSIGGAQLITGIDLQVERGQLVGVIGPNGAGKTTLFNLLTGITRPTAGSVRLGERDVTKLSAARRAKLGLGRTFQTSSLFPSLSALDNVRIALQSHDSGANSVLRRASTSTKSVGRARGHLAEVGLADRADVPAGSLAHGEQRKVEIAMVLATDPTVLLLDEPLAGVGSGDVEALAELIARIGREHDRTVLLVEHHMDVVLALVDHVAVLDHGVLLAYDTPRAVMANPLVQNAYLGFRGAA